MKAIVEHEIYGPVIINTETQTYEYIDIENIQLIGSTRYYETMILLEESVTKIAAVPLVCNGFKQMKKRTLASFLDWNNKILNFYNVEMINGAWTRNAIESAIYGKCYLAKLQRNPSAVNDFILLNLYELKKG